MAVKWIIADVDGCLSPEEAVPWDLERFWELAQISREATAGRGTVAPITLCTGRPQPYVEVLVKLLGIQAPAICENGAVLYSLQDNHPRYGPGVTEKAIADLRMLRSHITAHILPTQPEAVPQFGKEAQISIFSKQPDVLREIEELIAGYIRPMGKARPVITQSHYCLNVSLAGVDKGNTLQVLLDDLGVTRDEVAGIGDTEGDLPLRDAVGFFACPSNAQKIVKEVADYISPYPSVEGVLDILGLPEFSRL